MVCLKLCRRGFSVLMLLTSLTVFTHEAECLSLEIKGGQRNLTFRECVTSDILFSINQDTKRNDSTLYIYKDGQKHDQTNLCKLILTSTTCVSHSVSCQCHITSTEGRVEYDFQKQFQVNDSGEWVFDVWNTGVRTSVFITVQGKCLPVEIKGSQSKFTFVEGVTSDILFYINEDTNNNDSTLYIYKTGQNQAQANLCKLILTSTTCVSQSVSCQCHTALKGGRVEYAFQKQFRVNDSGEWVFDVWDDVKTSVFINVQVQPTKAPAPDIHTTVQPTKAPTPGYQGNGNYSDGSAVLAIVLPCGLATCLFFVYICRHFQAMQSDSLSVIIKSQQTFTVWEGEMTEISFFVNNIKKDENITLHISKNEQDEDQLSSCKLVLRQTSCISHSWSCKCSINLIEGRVEYVFWKKFRAQDSGKWVFEVWNSNVSTFITVTVRASRTKHILVNGGHQNLTLKLKEIFNLQFSFADPMADNEGIVLVQHRPLDAAVFERRCIITRSRKNCSSTMTLCRCLGPPFGIYSLQKVVAKEDSGTWLLNLWNAHTEREETLYVTVEAINTKYIVLKGGNQNLTLKPEEKLELRFSFFDAVDYSQDTMILVQHRPQGANKPSTKCVLKQSRENCTTSTEFCLCLGPPFSNYSLHQISAKEDSGLWLFKLWNEQIVLEETLDIILEGN